MTAEIILDKIQHLMEKTIERGCTEGEAQSAAELVQRLLTKYNLSVVDLERRGQKAPGIQKHEHDLGKAAFKWKLLLADVMAEHYFCYPMIDWTGKRVFFLGRPENTKALTMLYQWVIDQIRRFATEDRKLHIAKTGEHIDPLRWQVGFGEGAVYRLRERLREARKKAGADTTALVKHHLSEISDWMEAQGHYWRPDGQPTARDRKWQEERERQQKLHEERMADEAYRKMYEEMQARRAKEAEREQKRQERNRRRRTGREWREESASQREARYQRSQASDAGAVAADRVNLEPFIEGQAPGRKGIR